MYSYLIINQLTAIAKRDLRFFAVRPKSGCRVEILPYNNMWCNVIIRLHPNFAYSVILGYIRSNFKDCKCSKKAKEFIQKY